MSVANIIEKVNLILSREKCGPNRMYWRVAPSFVVETAALIQMLEKVHIRLRSPEIEVANFEVRPDCCKQILAISSIQRKRLTVTPVICLPVIIAHKPHSVVLGDMFGM